MPVKALLVAERGRDFTAIRGLLAEAGLETELDWVTTPEAARAALAKRRHEVCFLVLKPGQRGLPGLFAWDEFGPPVAIVVLMSGTGAEDEDTIMRAGASEVLDRETVAPAELARAVRRLLYREERGRRLREAVHRLGVTADLAPVGLVYVDRERRVQGANRRGASWLGRPGRNVAGASLSDLLGEDWPRIEPYVDAALRGQPVDFAIEMHRPGDGPPRSGVHLVPDPTGSGGFVAVVKEAAGAFGAEGPNVSDERLRDFGRMTGEWLWETDSDHRLTYLSDGAERQIGRAVERMIGRTPWQAFEAADETARAITDDMTAGRLLVDAVVTFRDERQAARAMLLAGKPLTAGNGTFLGYRGIGHDITGEVRATSAEFAVLDRLAGPAVASLTRQAFGQGSLDETMPEVFAQLVAEYGLELERAGEGGDERVQPLTPAIQDLVARLGFLRAGARDLVRLHRRALVERLKLAQPEPTRRMLGRSRLVLIAALAQLVGHYRTGATAERVDAQFVQARR